MPLAADRLDFGPPPQPGLVPSWVLALIAHALLMAALTWGIQWDRETQAISAVAELWAAVPQEAAPEPVVAPPIPQPQPPPPAPREEAKPEPKPREPDINEQREREKAKLREEAKRQEAERKERERRRAEAEAAEKRKEQEKLAAEKKRKAQQEEARLDKLRKENLERITKMAGTSPTPSPGTAMQSSGPSGNWAGRVRARVKPNIVFSDDVPGNPSAEVEVRLAPDGTIVSRRLVKSSGLKSWDDAVLRALDKTEVLPRDTDGRVPPAGILVFRPKD